MVSSVFLLAGLRQPRCTGLSLVMSAVSDEFLQRTGGEWAGWQCDFDEHGVLKPVDDKYLDEDIIEYGIRPAGFELLATERVEDNHLHRRFLRILPAMGCAADNLAAEVSVSHFTSHDLDRRLCGDQTLGVFTLDDPPGEGGDHWYLRTYFWAASGDPLTPRRTRLSFRWSGGRTLARGKLVRMAVERRWAEAGKLDLELNQGGASLKDGKASATGCDASFVAGVVGEPCFASSTAASSAEEHTDNESSNKIRLPQGIRILISPANDGCLLEISLATDGAARVVRRHYGANGDLTSLTYS